MGTTLRFKVGLVLALLGLLTLTLNPPPLALAQDDEPAAEVEAAQATEEETPPEPPAEDVEPPADDDTPEPPAEDVEPEPEPEPPADTTAPWIEQPGDVYAAADDANGAVVKFSRPGASDDFDGDVAVDCEPGSGSLFSLGTTVVTCSAWDSAGNSAAVSFAVVVSDQTAPAIDHGGDVVVDAQSADGAAVDFAIPSAWDNVDGEIAVSCDSASGAFFPVGTTVVTCWAQDSAGNSAEPVSFAVTVNALPEPTPTDPPTEEPTDEPSPTKTPVPTESPTDTPTESPTESPTQSPTDVPDGSQTPDDPTDPTPVTVPTPTETPKADGVASDPPTAPTPEALPLDEALINSFVLVYDGGPLGVLTSIWGNQDWPISQEYGHTAFSVTHHSWYAYGLDYGLDGYEHPGLDVGMPAGTPLYSPVDGVVKISGGVPYYTFYGNGKSHVGELLIETEDGDQVILGHMGRIAVDVGDEVKIGQFVGLSGGDNGDHLHLEARELDPFGGFKIVDPRKSFLVDVLEAAIKKTEAKAEAKAGATNATEDADEDAANDEANDDEATEDPTFDSLSQHVGRVIAISDQTSDKYARITVRRINCAVDSAGDAVAACGNNVLSGSSFTVYNPTMHGRTRVTDPTGLVSFGPRAGENVIEKAVDGEFEGAYVSCVAENTGRVLFDGPVTEPSLTLNTEPGDQIVCDWFNLTD